MLPVYVAVTRAGRDVGWLDVVAVVVGLAAVALELAADLQMYRFARTSAARPGDGPRAVGLVATPQLLR